MLKLVEVNTSTVLVGVAVDVVSEVSERDDRGATEDAALVTFHTRRGLPGGCDAVPPPASLSQHRSRNKITQNITFE